MLLGVEKEHIFGRPEGPATQYKVKLPIKPSLAPNVLVRVRILKDGQPSTIAKIPVKLKNTSNFRLVGLDLACTIPVSPSEAACGATISFRHLFGDQVSLSLPIGARDQQIFTLAGLGAPGDLNERSGKPGDLKVKIKIRQPNPLSSRAKQLIHDLDAEMFPGGVRRHFKSV
jgi:DnaJ-class molecular chaperone